MMSPIKLTVVAVLVAVIYAATFRGGDNPFGASCGQGCIVNDDCRQQDCTNCIQGICGAGCQQPCHQNSDCRDTNCKYCYQGKCDHSPHRNCSGACSVNTDCDQSGSCKMCLGGKCSAGCGQECDTHAQCLGSTCSKCILGICSKGNTQCLGVCQQNFDCVQSGDCAHCIGGQCGAGCNSACTADSQCLDPQCKFCTEGKCQHEQHQRKCHQSCTANDDCDADPKRCTQCVAGTCVSPCQSACVADSDCVTANCTKCVQGICSYNQVAGH